MDDRSSAIQSGGLPGRPTLTHHFQHSCQPWQTAWECTQSTVIVYSPPPCYCMQMMPVWWKSSSQMLRAQVDRWIDLIGIKAKIPKCCSLVIQSSIGKLLDPAQSLQEQQILYTSNQLIRFLGGDILIPTNVHNGRGIYQRS